MSKARLHPSLLEFNGAMGDMVFKKRNGKVYVSIKSQGTKDPSEAQLAQRKVFRKAVNYAKSVMADETTRAFYQALCQDKDTSAFALCVGDYLKAPKIEELDFTGYKGNAGDRILITATDDVGVVNVDVTLTASDGTLIEQGKAIEPVAGTGDWEYIATVPVPQGTEIFVSVEAYDRPGHKGASSANPTVGINN